MIAEKLCSVIQKHIAALTNVIELFSRKVYVLPVKLSLDPLFHLELGIRRNRLVIFDSLKQCFLLLWRILERSRPTWSP